MANSPSTPSSASPPTTALSEPTANLTPPSSSKPQGDATASKTPLVAVGAGAGTRAGSTAPGQQQQQQQPVKKACDNCRLRKTKVNPTLLYHHSTSTCICSITVAQPRVLGPLLATCSRTDTVHSYHAMLSVTLQIPAPTVPPAASSAHMPHPIAREGLLDGKQPPPPP